MTDSQTVTPSGAAVTPVRAGLAGLGRMGAYHLERLSLRADARPVAACDVDASRASTAERFGCRFAASWPEFLADDDVELVLIATPPETRASLVVEALHAGKHVLVETPPCLTPAETEAMAAASRESGCLLSVVQNRRWDDDFRAALRTIQSGALGRLQSAAFVVWNQGLPAEQGQRSGALLEFGPHYFDQLLLLADEEPQSVYARIRSSRGEPEDAFTAVVSFASGLTAHVEVDLTGFTPRYTGWLLSGTLGGYRNFRRYSRTPDGELFDIALERPPVEWDRVYEDAVAHLRRGGPVPAPFSEARRVVALIEAAQRSAETGQVVVPDD